MKELRIKKRLTAYMELEQHIDNLIEQYETARAQLEGISSPDISGMPRGSSGASHDRFANKIARCDDLEQKIQRKMAARDSERRSLEELIDALPKARQKSVIEMRYLDAMDWKEINQVLFGRNEDFAYREDTYMRKIFYAHGEALDIMEQMQTGND